MLTGNSNSLKLCEPNYNSNMEACNVIKFLKSGGELTLDALVQREARYVAIYSGGTMT